MIASSLLVVKNVLKNRSLVGFRKSGKIVAFDINFGKRKFCSGVGADQGGKDYLLGVLVGKPGGGKGTISKWLCRDFNFVHLSAGDILRHEVAVKSDLGKLAESYISSGSLMPDEIIADICNNKVASVLSKPKDKSNPNQRKLILLDGFPRTVKQAQLVEDFKFNNLNGQEEHLRVDFVANIEVPNDEIVSRLSDRWVHEDSGRVYSYKGKFNRPKVEGKDDETGESLIRRTDDMPEKILHRLEVFEEKTKPIIDHFRSKSHVAVFDISGDEYYDLVKNDERSKAIYKTLCRILETELSLTKSSSS